MGGGNALEMRHRSTRRFGKEVIILWECGAGVLGGLGRGGGFCSFKVS